MPIHKCAWSSPTALRTRDRARTHAPRPTVLTPCAAPEPHAAAVPCPRWCGPMERTGSTQTHHDRARGAGA